MWKSVLAASYRTAHHVPSLYQSLLSGLDSVGSVTAVPYVGPRYPTSPAAADAGATPNEGATAHPVAIRIVATSAIRQIPPGALIRGPPPLHARFDVA